MHPALQLGPGHAQGTPSPQNRRESLDFGQQGQAVGAVRTAPCPASPAPGQQLPAVPGLVLLKGPTPVWGKGMGRFPSMLTVGTAASRAAATKALKLA